MSGRKCGNCGSTDIESDSARADAICTKCGTVLESGMIVSDVTFMDTGFGGSAAVGTFVSGERKGGSNTFGGNFMTGIGRESREVTLKNAKSKIMALAQQLRLRQNHVDMSFYFYKLALSKGMTKGRKSSHVVAACIYITCRTEGTSHMLIDFSDILQVDVYELGRTYLRLSQALCINIPAMDPCLYIMRFAHKLDFGDKTHEVSMTALRLVGRMKKDWIHFGRRPSGLCGAALLIASRLHEFNRSFEDVVKVVKVHESTLRKRLNEFGQTNSSQLTLEEFMKADLDSMTEEMDPPCYAAARKKDQALLDRLGEMSAIDKEIAQIEMKIEKELEQRRSLMKGRHAKMSCNSSGDSHDSSGSRSSSSSDGEERQSKEVEDMQKFLQAETLGMIEECLDSSPKHLESQVSLDSLLMPPPGSPVVWTGSSLELSRSAARGAECSPGLGLKDTVEEYLRPSGVVNSHEKIEELGDELDVTGIDDVEIETYLMTPVEVKNKTKMWMKVNKEFLIELEIKKKRVKEEREEMIKNGIDPDKKKKVYRKRRSDLYDNATALEAIEKVAEEKKVSNKINYDILRNLTFESPKPTVEDSKIKKLEIDEPAGPIIISTNYESYGSKYYQQVTGGLAKKIKMDKKPNLLPRLSSRRSVPSKDIVSSTVEDDTAPVIETGPVEPEKEDDISDLSEEDEPLLSASELLSQQFGGGGGELGWGDEEYY